MEFMQVLSQCVESIITLVCTILIVLKLAQAIIKGTTKEEVLRLLKVYCESAEITWGSGQGDRKFTEAVEAFYHALPSYISIAYSIKDIQELISQLIIDYNINTPAGYKFRGIGKDPVPKKTTVVNETTSAEVK